MTSDERTFLDAICAQPDDDTARLVFADWLTENGQPDRGEFIRVEIELARTPPGTDSDERRRRVLFDRRTELLKQHQTTWLAPFTPFAKDSAFERGFVQELEVSAHTFLQNAEQWFALTPLTRVKITSCHVWDRPAGTRVRSAASLFASPHLSRLAKLDLESLQITDTDLAELSPQPGPWRLRELVLAWNSIGSTGAALLANLPQLGGLEDLDLRGNGITDTGARAVAKSPYLSRLKELRISRNAIREPTWRTLEDRFGDALVG
jgi:uncharacterized protein (TIGR02996 family)